VIACGALHLYGLHLAEIRSIAVHPEAKGKGAGRRIVKALMHEAERQQVTGVCLFTRIPEFFAHLGFELANREDLPDKIYKDCLACPRLHCCDEVAMVRGELPKYAFLHQHHIGRGLVKFEA
jgi:amino-acid N-acetyltransferase